MQGQPVLISMRALLMLLVLVTALSAAVAVGVTALSQPESAEAQGGSRAVVRELRILNRTVRNLDQHVGGTSFSGLRGDLRGYLGSTSFGGMRGELRSYLGPVGNINNVLEAICRNTRQSGSFTTC